MLSNGTVYYNIVDKIQHLIVHTYYSNDIIYCNALQLVIAILQYYTLCY